VPPPGPLTLDALFDPVARFGPPTEHPGQAMPRRGYNVPNELELLTPNTDVFEELFRFDPGWHLLNPVGVDSKGCESALFHEKHLRIANLDDPADQPMSLEPAILDSHWHGPIVAKKIEVWLTRQQAAFDAPREPDRGARGRGDRRASVKTQPKWSEFVRVDAGGWADAVSKMILNHDGTPITLFDTKYLNHSFLGAVSMDKQEVLEAVWWVG
jgi:hypothetical protein